MKKPLLFIQIGLFAFLMFFSIGNQDCLADTIPSLDGSGRSILLIEGDGDENDDVNFTVYDVGSPDYVVEFKIGSGDWQEVVSGATLEGDSGDILTFRIDVGAEGAPPYIYSYDEESATLMYSQGIPGANANPDRDDPYYQTVTIEWIDASLGDSFKMDVLTNLDEYDGFAPVPIPQSALLLGSAILGLIGIGRLRLNR